MILGANAARVYSLPGYRSVLLGWVTSGLYSMAIDDSIIAMLHTGTGYLLVTVYSFYRLPNMHFQKQYAQATKGARISFISEIPVWFKYIHSLFLVFPCKNN